MPQARDRRHQLPADCRIRSRGVLGGLHHEYWLEKVAAYHWTELLRSTGLAQAALQICGPGRREHLLEKIERAQHGEIYAFRTRTRFSRSTPCRSFE